MTLPGLCIQRPVFATVLSVIVFLMGLIAYNRLSVREYPRIEEPIVSVETVYQRQRGGGGIADHEGAGRLPRRHRGR